MPWRTSSTSSDVRECVLGPSACRGSSAEVDSSEYTDSAEYCNEGYEGPLCGTCSRTYFKNWAKLTCNLCKGIARKAPVNAPLIVIGIVVFLVAVYALCKRLATRGRLRRVIDRVNELMSSLGRRPTANVVAVIDDSMRQEQFMGSIALISAAKPGARCRTNRPWCARRCLTLGLGFR